MTELKVAGFDWDEGNRSKCQKHGVTTEEIEALFASEPGIAPAPGHSAIEERFIAVGRTNTGRPLFIGFTLRIRNKRLLIRPITARYMHVKEIAAYEKESASSQN